MRWRKALEGVLFAALPLLANHASGTDEVLALDEKFVRASLALSPSTATAQGYHEHEGRELDELLDDYSPAGIRLLHDLYGSSLAEANRIAKGKLSKEDLADLEVIRLQCKYGLLDLETIQSYRHNPTSYVETIGNAILQPIHSQLRAGRQEDGADHGAY